MEHARIKLTATTDEIFQDSADDIDFNAGDDGDVYNIGKYCNDSEYNEEEESARNIIQKVASESSCHKKRASSSKGSRGKGKQRTLWKDNKKDMELMALVP